MSFFYQGFFKSDAVATGNVPPRLHEALPMVVRMLRCGVVLALAILVSTTPEEQARGFAAALNLPEIRLLVLGLVVLELLMLLPVFTATPRPAPVIVRDLSSGNSDFMGVLDTCFAQWGLTSSERTVALYAIKGFSNAEIARLRDTVEATVKCQLNAIYRKAQVSGRSQLISTVLDEVLVILPRTLEPGSRSAA